MSTPLRIYEFYVPASNARRARLVGIAHFRWGKNLNTDKAVAERAQRLFGYRYFKVRVTKMSWGICCETLEELQWT